jgi:hypothetical protein
LLDEVDVPNLQNHGASGLEVKLNSTTAEGHQDAAAVLSVKQASSYLRIANLQELTAQALLVLTQSMSSKISQALQSADLPEDAKRQFVALQGTVQLVKAGAEDLENTNGFLANCALSQHNGAMRSRQKAWLASTKLPSALQQEVLRSDLATCPPEDKDQMCLLGPRGDKLIKDHFKTNEDDQFRDYKVLLAKAAAAQGKKNKFVKKTKKQPKQQTQVSQSAEAAP